MYHLHLQSLYLYKFPGCFYFFLLASCVSLLKPSQALSFASSCLLVCQCWSLLRLYPLPPLGFLCVTAEAFSGFILCLLWLLVCHCWSLLRLYPLPPLASCVSLLKPSQALSFAPSELLVCQCWSLLRLYPLLPLLANLDMLNGSVSDIHLSSNFSAAFPGFALPPFAAYNFCMVPANVSSL